MTRLDETLAEQVRQRDRWREGVAHRVATDAELRVELGLCDRWGIPHSHFLGGPLEWSELDRAKALAYVAYESTRCPDCRVREQEWNPDLGGNRDAYIGDSRRCETCRRAEDESENIHTLPEAERKGLKVVLRRNTELP